MSSKKVMSSSDEQGIGEKKPGRPTQGIDRSDTFKRSSKTHRLEKYASGKVDLKCFVDPETKAWLLSQKQALGVTTLGDVVDLMCRKATEK